MQFTPLKMVIAALWILGVGALGFLLPVSTATGWVVVAGIALAPPFFMLRGWRAPAQTMSESIRAVTRK